MLSQINFASVACAIFAFWMCAHTARKRSLNPSAMPRLQALRKLFGDAFGNRIHWLLYVALPFILGVVFARNALRGLPPF